VEFSKSRQKTKELGFGRYVRNPWRRLPIAKPTTDCQMGNTSISDAIWTATAEILFCPIAIFYSRFASSFCTPRISCEVATSRPLFT